MIGRLLPFIMLGILLAASLAKPLSRQPWVSLPVVLVAAGFLSSEIWVGLGEDTGLRWEILRDLVFYLLLPILIFEAAITMHIRALRREAILIGWLAVPLLLIAVWISAYIVHSLMASTLDGNWPVALLIGSMICATDPTTVSRILDGPAEKNRASQILEGESLINDATTITLFVMISGLLAAPGVEFDYAEMSGRFLLTLMGSAVIGLALGWLFDLIIGPANEKVLATSATLVLAFSSFWVAEHLLSLSGVVATLAAGLTIAWRQRVHRTEEDIAFAMDTWRTLGFLSNSMLFFLVGMSFTVQMFQDHWLAMLIGILAALVSRAAIVFLGIGPISRLPDLLLRHRRFPVPGFLQSRVDPVVGDDGSFHQSRALTLSEQNMIAWGGIRGAVAIALALSLSLDVPNWYVVQSTVYGVALFSLVVQTPLLPWLGAGDPRSSRIGVAGTVENRRTRPGPDA